MTDWSEACDPVPARRELTEAEKRRRIEWLARTRRARGYLAKGTEAVSLYRVDSDFDDMGAWMERLGIVDDIRAERAAILANVAPRHRARLLGKRPVYVEVKPAAEPPPPPAPPDISLSDAVRRAEQRAQNTRLPDPPIGAPSIYSIFVAVTDATGVTVGDLVSPSHVRRLARPRFLAAWLIKKLRPDMGFPAIGHALKRDHTTIMSAVKRFDALMTEPPYRDWLAHRAVAALLEKGGRP